MLLVGVLPGPRETSYTQLQAALYVLTAELQQLWVTGLEARGVRHRVFLFSVVCDTPAMRAVCGLGGVSSEHACPYCDGAFATRPGERQSHRDWRPAVTFAAGRPGQPLHPRTTHASRRRHAMVWVDAHTHERVSKWLKGRRSTQNKVWQADSVFRYLDEKIVGKQKAAHTEERAADLEKEQETSSSDDGDSDNDDTMVAADDAGHHDAAADTVSHSASTRWCALFDLPYFDIVRCVPIDAMHNLLLGLCKHIMSILTGHHDKKTSPTASSNHSAQQPHDTAPAAAAATAVAASGAKRQKVAGSATKTAVTIITAATAAATAPAAAPRVKSSVKPAGILLEKDLEALQRSVASCDTPRDIGRMTSRLDSLDSIKAVEWLNIFATFIVPFVRSRMPGHTQLRGEHLALLTRVANVVTLSTSYFTTPQMVDELHGELVQVMLDVERLNPQTSSYISPNMHLSLHLAAQLRDHGPATSWWTFPYERLMGLTANIPFRPGRSSVDTAKRALALLEVTARATPPLEEKSCFGRFGIRLPDGPGFEHGVRRTDSGGRYHWFRFVSSRGSAAARLLQLRRVARCDEDVRGCEPYPGLLFNSGQLFKPRGGRTRSVPLSGKISDDDASSAAAAAAFYKQLQEASARHGGGTPTLAHVRTCLLYHHMATRWQELRSLYDAAIAAAAGSPEQQTALRDEQRCFASAGTNRLPVGTALLHGHSRAWRADASAAGAAAVGAATAYSTVLRWYHAKCGGAAGWDRVDVYDKLFYAGEEFGSDIASSGQNAWISANCADDERASRVRVWYARVGFYVRHMFDGQPHDFAMPCWFDFAEPTFVDELKAAPPARWHHAPRPLESVQATFADYPILTRAVRGEDFRDIVPVHRITGRWIAMGDHPDYQYACPIRSRVHH